MGGELTRDPAATVGGNVQRVFNSDWVDFGWLRPWVERCLLYGRPLAFSHGLGWAWSLALGLLALYVVIALAFRGAVERCVSTLETQPGNSILAALLTLLLTPVLFVLLIITVLGIAAVPFLVIGLFAAAFFGKVVVLASIGRRCTPMLANEPVAHTVVGVIVGGAIALFLYTIPVIGFIVYKLLGILGMGVVMYTLLIAVRSERQARAAARGNGPAGPDLSPGPAGPAQAGPAQAGPIPSTNQAPGPTPPSQGSDSTMHSANSNFGDFAAGPGVGAGPVPPTGGPPPPPPSGPAPSSVPPTSLPRAGFGVRMGALLLDIILVGIVLHQVNEGHELMLIVLATYGAVMWKLKGATIGAIICGLQVVRLDGRPVDWPTAIVRALSCFLSLAVVGLGFWWIAIDGEHQAWHDNIAGTVVVKAPKGSSLL